MDKSIEAYFVETFIRKNRRDRIMLELTNPKKRYDGLDRFCHQAADLLDPEKVTMKANNLESLPGFVMFMKTHDEICTILSPNGNVDGQKLPFMEAVRQAILCQDAAIIVGNGFAAVFTEPMKGGHDKYLLTETKKKGTW